MKVKSDNRVFEWLAESPQQNEPGSIALKLGREHELQFCSHPTSSNRSSGPILSRAEQLKMVIDLLDGIDARAVSRCMERSTIQIPGHDEKIALSEVSDMAMEAAVEAANADRRQPASFDAMMLFGSDVEGSLRDNNPDLLIDHKRYLKNNWLRAAAHTGSLETPLLLIDNVDYVDLAAAFEKDPLALMTYNPNVPSAGGSLSNGLRSVVLGRETTTPQGYMQAGFLLAKEYTANAQLIVDSHKDTWEILTQAQLAAARGLLRACDSLSTLQKQVSDREWDGQLIEQNTLARIQDLGARVRNQTHLPDREYAELASQFMSNLGREVLRQEAPVRDDNGPSGP